MPGGPSQSTATAHRHRRFVRGRCSAARLTYEPITPADGHPDETTTPLIGQVIGPLCGAFRALLAARHRRGTLDLDLPERRIILDDQGEVRRLEPRQRLDSHRLIEEFMIAANVAAAETLERARRPCMYRVHDAPDAAKIEALREFVATLGFNLAKGQVLRPKMFTQLLERVKGSPFAEMVHELVLRSQSQAVYSPGLGTGRCGATPFHRRSAAMPTSGPSRLIAAPASAKTG